MTVDLVDIIVAILKLGYLVKNIDFDIVKTVTRCG